MIDSPRPNSGRILTSSDILCNAKTALMYEELRAAIDGGHESMTHADALAEISTIRAENGTLRGGYAAARLEIESLQARIKTMAEEHADELMLAHLDGRMRAAQPAGAQQPGTAYAELPSYEHQRAIMEAERNASLDEYSRIVLLTSTESRIYERAFTNGWNRRASHGQAQALAAPQQEAPAMPSGWVSCTIEFDGSGPEEVAYGPKIMMDRLAKWLGKHFERTIAEKAAPQPLPASQGDALDAARLDWLLLHISGAEFRRIGVHYSGNARRADVDAARNQGANHD